MSILQRWWGWSPLRRRLILGLSTIVAVSMFPIVFGHLAVSFDTARFLVHRLSGNLSPNVQELVVFDVITGRRLGRSDDERAAVAISADGKMLATPAEGAVRVRDLPASRE